MKRLLLIIITTVGGIVGLNAQNFEEYFEDATLRLDYVFAGNVKEQHIYLQEMKKQDKWAGRKGRLSEIFLLGNGQVTVKDHASQKVIYANTFSTLFQEWLQYNEAKKLCRPFETSHNVPFPKNTVDVTVTLTNNHHAVIAEMTHTVDPKDILIRKIGDNGIPFHYVWKGNPNGASLTTTRESEDPFTPSKYDPSANVNLTECVDLAIVAEGYTASEMGKFYADCERAVEALFTWEPFRSLKNRFNIVAVAAPSMESGPSVPSRGLWKMTATGSHYDTFYTDRYLFSQDMHKIYDLLSGVPFEHVMVLVNSNTYGGGGIYNQLTYATSDHPTFKEIFVHEFGHSYGGLGDEYAYDDVDSEWYPADTEPWEPNLTTLKDFNSKWADLMPKKQPIPTPLNPQVPDYRQINPNDTKAMNALNKATQVVGVFEGAGYQSKGCYRPAQECRMKINQVEDFCPVCTRAIRGITDFNTAK